MGKITKTPFVMCYILRISVLWSCWPNKPKPIPNQQYKSSLVALTLGPRGVQLWWQPDSHPAQRSKSSQSSGALRRARNKVKGFISLSSKDRWSSRDMIWPVRKSDQFDKSFFMVSACVYLGTLTSTAYYLKVHSVRDEELKKECYWKNTFHINVTGPKDLSCDSIIDLDQMNGTACSALCSMLACSYGFLCGQIFFYQ